MSDDDDRYERMEADEMTADRHAEDVARLEGEIAKLRAALTEACDIATWALSVEMDLVPDSEVERRLARITDLDKLTEG